MTRLDEAIASIAYILDTPMAYRRINESGHCNNCGRKPCEYSPNLGEQIRYNCPFYEAMK